MRKIVEIDESRCNGCGLCVPACAEGAIQIIDGKARLVSEAHCDGLGACLGECPQGAISIAQREAVAFDEAPSESVPSALGNWPVQMHLISPEAPLLRQADLLLVADCVPFAMADFHGRLLRGRPVVVGCPKLDDGQYYVEKLARILSVADVRSVTVVHMEVPCCTGLVRIAEQARKLAQSAIPLEDVTISIRGKVL